MIRWGDRHGSHNWFKAWPPGVRLVPSAQEKWPRSEVDHVPSPSTCVTCSVQYLFPLRLQGVPFNQACSKFTFTQNFQHTLRKSKNQSPWMVQAAIHCRYSPRQSVHNDNKEILRKHRPELHNTVHFWARVQANYIVTKFIKLRPTRWCLKTWRNQYNDHIKQNVNRPGREVNHSPPSSATVKNWWSYTSTPPTWLHGVDRANLNFQVQYMMVVCTIKFIPLTWRLLWSVFTLLITK
jgi:hypothetical protein